MARMLAAALLFAALAFADQAADRTAIEKVVQALKTAEPVSALFTADAESDLERLRAIEASMAKAAHQPWSELWDPALVIDSVRFVSPDVALVNAAEKQVGAAAAQRVPVLFLMKRESAGWKITLLRVLYAGFAGRTPPGRR